MAAETSHLVDVMIAVRERILSLTPLFPGLAVEIGHPARWAAYAGEPPLVVVFVYRIVADNAAWPVHPGSILPVRLFTLVTVYCAKSEPAESSGTKELRVLSHVARLFHETPEIGPVRVREAVALPPATLMPATDLKIQAVLLAPEMEEINHIWTTQGEAAFRTSLVYEFSFGIIAPSAPADEGPPVLATAGLVEGAMPPKAPPPAASRGVLVLRVPTGGGHALSSVAEEPAGAGDAIFAVVAVAETAQALALVLERFEPAAGGWTALPAPTPAQIAAQARPALAAGAPLVPVSVTVPRPAAAAIYRLRATRAGAAADAFADPVVITFTGGAP